MTDFDRIEILKARLADLELRIPSAHERAIIEVAREALREQLGAIGRRLSRRGYWRAASAAARVG